MKLCMFRAVPLPIIRSLLTVHSALVYVMQICRQLSNRTRLVLLESCLQTCMTYTIAEWTVSKLLMIGRGTARNMQSFMPKYICEISACSWFYYKETEISLGGFSSFLQNVQPNHVINKTKLFAVLHLG
jgi:hypothetical protein